MKSKLILILVDGMRPDALSKLKNPFVAKFLAESRCYLDGKTVQPSVTLPAHMSLFHSVPPQRHGILTNTFVPQVHQVDGLFEVLRKAGKTQTMFYNWEELRDLGRPESMTASVLFQELDPLLYGKTDNLVTEAAVHTIENLAPDFSFVYLGETDEAGHCHGWMGDQYLQVLENAWRCIQTMVEKFGREYGILVLSDHGGHDRTHGTDLPEDMTIPVILHNLPMAHRESVSILDVAPTVAAFLGVSPDPQWEGRSLI